MSYPENSAFIVFSESEDISNDFTLCLDRVCERKRWTNITEAVEAIAQAITGALENGHQDQSDVDIDEDDASTWDVESQYEELEPMELSSPGRDRRPKLDLHSDLVFPLSARTLAGLTKDLRQAQVADLTVGIYPRQGSNVPQVISLSARATCLGLSAGVLEAWGLRETDNLVLLMRIVSSYPTVSEFIELPERQTSLSFRFGRCAGEKPSLASVTSAYRDVKLFDDDQDYENHAEDSDGHQPFEVINMTSSIDSLLNRSFMRLLKYRRHCGLSWGQAQHIVTQEYLRVQSNITGELEEVEIAAMDTDDTPWQTLVGPIARDAVLDDEPEFSLPLVAMQLALHRMANCTRYCMVCNALLEESVQGLKPYVCEDSLCLFQYVSLGLGSSIEHEIINAPYVVDMLISFLYSALAHWTARELPTGLGIKTAYVDEPWAQESHATASANFTLMKLRELDFSTLTNPNLENASEKALREGDRVILVHLQPGMGTESHMDAHIKSWCRLLACAEGEWSFETYHTVTSMRAKSKSSDNPTSNGWYSSELYGYWQNIDAFADDLDIDKRRASLLTILDGLPSVLDMRAYLTAQPGRRLATWSRINASELAVLNWTVASNRSLIVQDDIVGPTADLTKPWSKVLSYNAVHESWMQFRFMQGSRDRETAFEDKVNELMEKTRTPTIFAWHGSRLKNWHSIIRTGLDFQSHENGRAYGNGVYFSPYLLTSLGYSDRGRIVPQHQTNVPLHWSKSQLQISSAIAVCELINEPGRFLSSEPHYVVDKLDWIQCRYLLVSINPTAAATGLPLYELPANATRAYALQDPTRRIYDESPNKPIQMPVTALPHSRRQRQMEVPVGTKENPISVPDIDSSTPTTVRSQFPYDTDDVEVYLGAYKADGETANVTAIKRRGSLGSDSSCVSLYSNKRPRGLSGTSVTENLDSAQEAWQKFGFNPNSLALDSLRMLEPPTWAATSKQAVRRLAMDMKDLHERQTAKVDLSGGYFVHTDKSDNMFQWIVEFFGFDKELPLAADMERLKCGSVVLEFRFGPNYPMSPPFVRIIRPRFLPFAEGGGGHITMGGAVCLELLTNSGWNPAINIDNVIMQIRAALSETERPARLDSRVTADYGVGEAVAAFTRLARAHGWAVPDDFLQIAAL